MRDLALAALLLAACGNDSRTNRDAGDGDGNGNGSDAAHDADIDADPNVRGTVTARVVDKMGTPVQGMHVVFIDTDTTVTDLITDAAGMVTASVYPGASLTAVRADSSGLAYSMTTVLSLVPNDTVTLIGTASAGSLSEDPFTQRIVPLPSVDIATATKSGSTGTFTTIGSHGLVTGDRVIVDDVSNTGYDGSWTVASTPTTTSFTANIGTGGLPSATGGIAAKALAFTVNYTAYAGATSYEVHTPCGPVDVGTSIAPTLVLRAGCASPGDVLVFAKTSTTTEAAYRIASNVTFTAGGSVTIADTWHPVTSFTATLSNPTTRVTDVTLERFTPYVRGNAQAVANASTTGNPVMLTFNTASPATAWMRTILRCPPGSGADCISSGIGIAQQTITHQVNGAATTYGLDIGANLLPWVNAVYLPQQTTIDITVTGTGAIDLFEANLRYFRMVGSDQRIYTWRVFGPVAADVKFPTLPASVPGDPTVRPTDAQSAYQVYLCETDAVGGYRVAIRNVYETLSTCESNSAPTTKPAAGTINRLSSWN